MVTKMLYLIAPLLIDSSVITGWENYQTMCLLTLSWRYWISPTITLALLPKDWPMHRLYQICESQSHSSLLLAPSPPPSPTLLLLLLLLLPSIHKNTTMHVAYCHITSLHQTTQQQPISPAWPQCIQWYSRSYKSVSLSVKCCRRMIVLYIIMCHL